jgi:hypothetical protein
MGVNKVIEYFDLASPYRAAGSSAVAGTKTRQLHWLPQYLALLLGIVAQPPLSNYMTTGQWQLKGIWGWLFASLLIAVMAFPAVYDRSFDVRKPLFVQLCVLFALGIGWQSLVGSALKAAGAAPT